MSQDNEFNQVHGLEGHWRDVLAAEGPLLTACGQHTSKFEVERGFSGYPAGGYPLQDSNGRLIGYAKLKSKYDSRGKLLDPPGPQYFASLGQSKLTDADFESFDLSGLKQPELLSIGFGDVVIRNEAQWRDDLLAASNPNSGPGSFAIDLNKYLKTEDRLRVVWIR